MEKKDLNTKEMLKDAAENFKSLVARLNEINEKDLFLLMNQMERKAERQDSLLLTV